MPSDKIQKPTISYQVNAYPTLQQFKAAKMGAINLSTIEKANSSVNKPYMSLSEVNKKLNELNDVLNNPKATAAEKQAANEEMTKFKKMIIQTNKDLKSSYELRAMKCNGSPETPFIDFNAINHEK